MWNNMSCGDLQASEPAKLINRENDTQTLSNYRLLSIFAISVLATSVAYMPAC
jgi:hypothetical protein